MMLRIRNRPFWLNTLIILLAPVAGMALGVAVTLLSHLDETASTLTINLFFFVAVVALISFFRLPRAALGLQVRQGQIGRHVVYSLLVLTLYLLFYVFAIRISALKPFTSSIGWGLLSNLIIALTEELYFRGLLYGFIQKRFSARAALAVSTLLFGLFHARQGMSGVIARLFTGWLWGSVRYATGMIFLLIFPIHYAFNTVWLLFAGNWSNPPAWAPVALPIVEFTLGLAFVFIRNRQAEQSWK